MHGDLALLRQRPHLGQAERARVRDEAAYLETPVLEAVPQQQLVLRRLGRSSVHDEVRRDGAGWVLLPGACVQGQRPHWRRDQRAERALHAARREPGVPGGEPIGQQDERDQGQPDRYGLPLRLIGLTEDDICHVGTESRVHHHRRMYDDEDDEGGEAEKVETTSALAAPEQPGIAREPRLNGWRLRRPREDQERGQQEDDRRVGELLQRIEGVERARGRLPPRHIDEERVPGGREDSPGGGDKPRPFARGEQQDHVGQPIEHPAERGAEMPVPSHAQVVASRLPQPRRDRFFHIERGPEPILRHSFLGECEPLRPRRTMHVPVQPGIRRQNLDASTDQEPDEEDVDPVRRPYPAGKAE